MTKLNGQSEDILKDNIAALRELFPEVCCEGKVDFDKLKQVLGEYTDDSAERYNFTWNGKGQALRLSQTPSMGTLRPCKAESKNWDDTQNLYIEGDNLEVLKLLQKSYHGKVKMIYIDPPYNTGNDFVYPDDFSDSLENYKEITGQVDAEGRKVSTNTEANGRYHTDWLNMMYPRLRLARNLLTDDGVIFISIDDNEDENMKKLCGEVFGESNFLAQVIWERAYSPVNLKKHFSESHDYILCYAKNAEVAVCNGLPRSDEANDRYDNPDNDPRGPWKSSDLSVGPAIASKVYEITTPSGRRVLPPNGYCWRLDKGRFKEFVDDNRIWFGSDGNNVPSIKRFLSEVKQGITPMTIWKYAEVGHSQDAAQKLKQLFDGIALFDYPKSVGLIERCVQLYSDTGSIILDFFSGSATTAHAVMQLNAEDGGNRKYIMVQLPELCAEGTEAAKAGYKNICEIGKERIRRAGEKIKAEVEEQNAQLKIGEEPKKVPDIGFKDFKLDTSNLRKWQPDADDLEQSLFDSISNYVDGRSELDVVYEIMLKMGLDLTWPLETRTYGGKNVYAIGMGALMICLDDHITPDVAEGMVALHKELAPETWKVVFKDNGFADDSAKVNIKEILKCAGLDEDAFTTV
ncbi:site-specific DNA-methyltransferase [Caproiciproducens galactitolivorans]|jgi:adenine-specific DNA-methyltransferase|uniref:Putative methyltransferase n=1 Tax=Caproiciproducens galactitolivorans TaxID=642589 RepID=A0A4Z0YFE7_9FIRM|nr:site-specific DNA-methyltransferase [Caproiciproducens galactitolivorans]QEY34199.1 site-specific DNA-methyltransferase [Caproiciproducens galactitolivorans]TGJ78045.1 putative methyltransferase [Caproiciproducens galactitolivorans]